MITPKKYAKLRDASLQDGEKACYCGHTAMCVCGNPDKATLQANNPRDLYRNLVDNISLQILKDAGKNNISADMIVDVWLEEFFDTTLEKEMKNYEPDKEGNYSADQTRDFYDKHRVSQDQHDWWEKEVKKVFKKYHSAKYVEKSWWSVSLNTSPSIIRDE